MQDSYDKRLENKEALYAHILNITNNPAKFSGANDIVVTKVAGGCAEGELTVTLRSMNPLGSVHGGCLCTLADTVAGCAVASHGAACVTLSSTINFLAPATGTKKIRCEATTQKAGATIHVIDCRMTNDAGQTVATSVLTFYKKDLPDAPDL